MEVAPLDLRNVESTLQSLTVQRSKTWLWAQAPVCLPEFFADDFTVYIARNRGVLARYAIVIHNISSYFIITNYIEYKN